MANCSPSEMAVLPTSFRPFNDRDAILREAHVALDDAAIVRSCTRWSLMGATPRGVKQCKSITGDRGLISLLCHHA